MARLGLPIAVIACLSVAAGCDSEAPAPEPLTPVRVHTVQTRELDAARRYSATINPDKSVDVAFRVSGNVVTILQARAADGTSRPIQTGDVVKTGQVLARIDPDAYRDKVKGARGQLAEARAALVKGEADFKRARALYNERSMTAPEYDTYKKEFETARAAVESAKAQLAAAELDLGYCNLASPLDGVVMQRRVEIGTLVEPGSVAFVVADVASVKAVFGVPDVELGDVKEGANLTIETDSVPNRGFAGTVTSIAASADSTTRVFSVEVTVPNREGLLRPGMVASLDLKQAGAAPSRVATVPISAVVRAKDDPQGYAVYLAEVKDGGATVHLRDIRIGTVLGDSVAVTSGLDPGARVVVYGATLVRDGEKVKVIP